MIWVYLFVVRFKETGNICSGDYLEENESDKGYTTDMGLFIKFMLIIAILGACFAFAEGILLILMMCFAKIKLCIRNCRDSCLGRREVPQE